jgi:hypothetical protein
MSDPQKAAELPVVRNTTEARPGKPVGAMRWVLGLGLAGVVIAFVVVWMLTAR